VVSVVYGAVLAGGVYWWFVGEGAGSPMRLLALVGVFAVLFGLDVVERRRYPASTPTGPAVGLLGARVALFVVAALLDGSGTSRALLVLVPFIAYFAFGRTVSVALAGACLALVVVGFTASTPAWYRAAEYVSDLLMIGIGLVLAVCMAAVAVAERDARDRLERSLGQVAELSAATERNRVARDIHDSLGHHLTAIAIQLEKASTFSARDPALSAQALRDARSSARDALTEVRRSVRALRDEAPPFSLPAALTDLAGQIDGEDLSVTLDISGEPDGYDAASLTALYRAAQEALTNARRHAQASAVRVSVAFDDVDARLVVADDGRGFPAREHGGFGLLGMRERVQLLGGQMHIDSRQGAGTVVTVSIPRASAPARASV
jgi:signal transduction histidine kinase